MEKGIRMNTNELPSIGCNGFWVVPDKVNGDLFTYIKFGDMIIITNPPLKNPFVFGIYVSDKNTVTFTSVIQETSKYVGSYNPKLGSKSFYS